MRSHAWHLFNTVSLSLPLFFLPLSVFFFFFFFFPPRLQHLQKQERACSSDSYSFYCVLCDYSSKAKLNLVQHQRSLKHQQNEGLRKLQLHQQGLPLEEDNLAEIFLVRDCPQAETGELHHFYFSTPAPSSCQPTFLLLLLLLLAFFYLSPPSSPPPSPSDPERSCST